MILGEYIMENITLEELEILKSIKESLKNLDEKELNETPVFRGLHHECLEAILRKS